jgi:hypothetical protein
LSRSRNKGRGGTSSDDSAEGHAWGWAVSAEKSDLWTVAAVVETQSNVLTGTAATAAAAAVASAVSGLTAVVAYAEAMAAGLCWLEAPVDGIEARSAGQETR